MNFYQLYNLINETIIDRSNPKNDPELVSPNLVDGKFMQQVINTHLKDKETVDISYPQQYVNFIKNYSNKNILKDIEKAVYDSLSLPPQDRPFIASVYSETNDKNFNNFLTAVDYFSGACKQKIHRLNNGFQDDENKKDSMGDWITISIAKNDLQVLSKWGSVSRSIRNATILLDAFLENDENFEDKPFGGVVTVIEEIQKLFPVLNKLIEQFSKL